MFSPAPLLTLDEACAMREQMEREGKRLVFTNGCFDILHAGHVRYLREARALGDALLVGLNSDASVTQLKGPGRPLNTAADRGEVLRSLRAVEGLVVFDEPRTTTLLQSLRPHVFAKGGDYSLETMHPEEREVLLACGTEMHFLPHSSGRSTSALLQKIAGTPLRE